MKREQSLENLPEIANEMLGGLNAGPALKNRILAEAGGESRKPFRFPVRQAALAACALVLAVGIFAIPKPGAPVSEENVPELMVYSLSAGEEV